MKAFISPLIVFTVVLGGFVGFSKDVSAAGQDIPVICRNMVNAMLACYRNTEAVDKVVDPKNVVVDEQHIENVERQRDVVMPNAIRLHGRASLEGQCKTTFRNTVLGTESSQVEQILKLGGDASACEKAVESIK